MPLISLGVASHVQRDGSVELIAQPDVLQARRHPEEGADKPEGKDETQGDDDGDLNGFAETVADRVAVVSKELHDGGLLALDDEETVALQVDLEASGWLLLHAFAGFGR